MWSCVTGQLSDTMANVSALYFSSVFDLQQQQISRSLRLSAMWCWVASCRGQKGGSKLWELNHNSGAESWTNKKHYKA